MKESERIARDREIVTLFLEGNRPAHIGSLYDLEAVRVRRIIHAAGYAIEREVDNRFWDQSEPELREAIWERQREGARQALRA